MHTHIENLNPAQREAVLHKDGPLLVVAGAGAGKTRVVTHRIAKLIRSGVAPEEILAVTFTNKAAGEMRDRVSRLAGDNNQLLIINNYGQGPFIGTFHSLGVRILREEGNAIGIKKSFIIKDRDDSKSLMREAIKNEGLDPKQFEPGKMLSYISRLKGDLKTPDLYESESGGDYFPDIAVRVWRAYDALLENEGALDFDDLLLKAVTLLQKDEATRAYFQNRWRYMHIDEYQDTNHAQYVLAKTLAEKHRNICAVADADQLIYGWRGARIRHVLRFGKEYPDAKTILLEENYRSTKTILAAANKVIKKNQMRQEKTLFTSRGEGEKIGFFAAPDEMGEAYYVAEKARELMERGLTASDAQAGVKAEKIAVLYRTNFQSRALEEAFLALQVPYVVLGTRFFERKEVKDVLSYIRAALNPESLSDIKRVINTPPRGIGKATIAKLFSGQRGTLTEKTEEKVEAFYALLLRIKETSNKKTPSELIAYVLQTSGIKEQLEKEGDGGTERLQNIHELGTLASRYSTNNDSASVPRSVPRQFREDTNTEQNQNILHERNKYAHALERFLEAAALASDQDTLQRKGEGVRLMTVHAAKGLEFPYVFVTGLEQGLFPNKARIDADSERIHADRNEEERRLFYVALTRAQEKVFLSYAETRSFFGNRELNMPSEFLSDIPSELIELESVEEDEVMPSIL